MREKCQTGQGCHFQRGPTHAHTNPNRLLQNMHSRRADKGHCCLARTGFHYSCVYYPIVQSITTTHRARKITQSGQELKLKSQFHSRQQRNGSVPLQMQPHRDLCGEVRAREAMARIHIWRQPMGFPWPHTKVEAMKQVNTTSCVAEGNVQYFKGHKTLPHHQAGFSGSSNWGGGNGPQPWVRNPLLGTQPPPPASPWPLPVQSTAFGVTGKGRRERLHFAGRED